MRIKVFKAPTMKEAMANVKAELGDDAVILHTKRYRKGGLLGFKSKEIIEIIAAVEDEPINKTAANRLAAAATRYEPDNYYDVPARDEFIKAPSPLSDNQGIAPMSSVGASERPSFTPKNILGQYKTTGTQQGVDQAQADVDSLLSGNVSNRFAEVLNSIANANSNGNKPKHISQIPPEMPASVENQADANSVAHDLPTNDNDSFEVNNSSASDNSHVNIDNNTIEPDSNREESATGSNLELDGQNINNCNDAVFVDVDNDVNKEKSDNDVTEPEPDAGVNAGEISAATHDNIENIVELAGKAHDTESNTDEIAAEAEISSDARTKETPMSSNAKEIEADNNSNDRTLDTVTDSDDKTAEDTSDKKNQEAANTIISPSTEVNVPPAEQQDIPENVDGAWIEDKDDKIQQLENELAEMKEMLSKAASDVAPESKVRNIEKALRENEVSEAIIQDLISKMNGTEILADADSRKVKEIFAKFLRRTIRVANGITLYSNKPKIVALIGPTGVGKTTTLAKIAAKFVLEKGISAAMITADTYRISAVEQLKTYSDIIGLPIEIVYSSDALEQAINKHKKKQLILIDTAGRSQFNDYQMKELKDLLDVDFDIEKHLVLSSTTKNRDVEQILERFSVCNPSRIIFTKNDETSSSGIVLNLLYKKKIALSYMTNGQSVPDDISPASIEKLADLLMR